ncbi:MAG: HAMP domain-containing sensor histidine kinase [Cyanobacteria bacterium P01_A01_bin.116]
MTRDTSGAGAEANNAPTSDANWPLAYQRLLAIERFKSGFLARTSHELRSPINTIVSLHQLILEDLCEGPEEEKEFLDQSKAAALKMLALFDQITAVSKLDIGREPPKLEAVDLSFLLPEIEMLTTLQAANQNVRYTVASPTEEIAVHTDEKWLKNILVSLIQNSIAHTKRLSLAVEKTPQAIALVIECDRSATDLQEALDDIDNAVDLPAVAPDEQTALPAHASKSIPPVKNIQEDIQLSTGLVLAMAQTALPLIKGSFAIAPHPAAEDRSQITCRFPLNTP